MRVPNRIYPEGLRAQQASATSWIDTVVRAVAVKDSYTYSAAHTSLADIPAPARVGTSAVFASKTTALNGDLTEVDAANGSISGVSEAFNALAVYFVGASESLSYLIAYIDTVLDDDDVTEIPIAVDPTNADVTIQWNDGGIYTLDTSVS